MQIPRYNISDSIQDISEALNEAGWVVIEDAQSEEHAELVKSELAEYMSDAPYSDEDDPEAFYPAKTKRVSALMARAPSSHKLALDPAVAQLCADHLGPNCERYQLHVSAALEVGPGAREQILHREEGGFTFFELPKPYLVIAAMWAMSDFKKENGATLLVPGSHQWAADREAAPEEVKVAEMPKGSVLVWMGGTLHAAGANTSDEWRYGIILSYSLGWLRQEENMYLDLPFHIAQEQPKEIRELVGYPMHGPLGFFDPRVAVSQS